MNSIVTDRKFVALLGMYLDRFKEIGPDTWNFRCPVCGDSKENPNRARGYVYSKGNRLVFHCHNCGHHSGVYGLLQHTNSQLAGEYAIENFVNKYEPVKFEYHMPTQIIPVPTQNDINLPSIASLPSTHPAVEYMNSRKIPASKFDELYYADDFKDFVSKKSPITDKVKVSDSRIVIPIRNRQHKLIGFQGNLIPPQTGPRYYSIRLIQEDLIYGLDKVDESEQVYVVEGTYDSMFIPNAVAAMTSALERVNIHDAVYVWDNEPYNPEIIQFMKKAIFHDRKIVIWPTSPTSKEDINSMVLNGVDPLKVIRDNTFQGPRAVLEFDKWRKHD